MQALFEHFAFALLVWWEGLPVIKAILVAVLGLAVWAAVAVLGFEWLRGPVNLRVLEGVWLVGAAKFSRRTAHRDKSKRPLQLMFGQVP
jgi:hypothetical protein